MGAWIIAMKDLRVILKDRGALFTLLALPVVFISFLGVSTGQLLTTRDELDLVKVGFVDENRSDMSEQVFHDLAAIGGLKVQKVANRDQAKMWLHDGRSSVVIILGHEFDKRVDELDLGDVFDAEHGRLARGVSALDMQVESGASFAAVAQLVQYVVLSAVLRVVAPEVARRNSFFSRMLDQMIARHQESYRMGHDGTPPQIGKVKSGANIIYQTLVPAFVVMFAYFLVNIMASSFINERSLGTLRRIQTTRISWLQLLCGKTLPFLIISIIQCSLLFVSGKIMFGMSWGMYPFMLLPVIVTTALSATGMGLLLTSFVRTESQVASYSTFLVVVMAGVSGCYLPRDWLPALMKNFSLVTPHAWALIAYQELLTSEHPNMGLVSACCGMLAMIGVVSFAIGSLQFRRLEYPS